MSDPVRQFQDAMREQGLAHPGEIIADGKLHRYAPEGERSDSTHAWYVFHPDHPASGAFGSWKGDTHKWTSNPGRELTTTEKKLLKDRMEADRKRREEDDRARRAEASRRATDIWSKALPVGDHPYLARKEIKGLSARLYGTLLTIPVISSGELVGLQFIPEDGKDKKFLKDSQIEGSYCLIGPRPVDRLVICEGYATGESIHLATELPVFAAFNAGNLVPVAKALRERLPDAEIIIAADDDRWTTEPMPNPGVHFATRAAGEARGVLRRPMFKPGFEGRPTDFNDLHVAYGIDEVRTQILDGRPTFELEVVQSGERSELRLLEPFPHMSGKGGKPLATIENVEELLGRMGVIVRYNVITKNQEIIIPHESFSLDNRDNASLSKIISWASFAKMPTDKIPEFISYLADKNPYNPVATWITSKPWDGTKRLGEFFSTVTAKGEADTRVRHMKETFILRWMVSAIAGAFNPNGVSAHGILVFQGDQNLGKTQWFKRLVPGHLDVIADGMILRADDKDSVKQIISKWLVELGELDATFRRSDIAQLKAFITRDRDILRMPFARKENTFARRTLFFASVNPEQFLHDPTGNRRYWTIACERIKHDHTIDMQQVWAEVYELYKEGESWFLSPKEMDILNASNKDFEVRDSIEDLIEARFKWDSPEATWTFRPLIDILMELGYSRPSTAEITKAGIVFRKLNGGHTKRTKAIRLTLCPPSQVAYFEKNDQAPLRHDPNLAF